MRRGFKADAEKIASQLRGRVSCPDDQTVALDSLAQELGVELMPADRLVPIERLRELEQLQDDAFSAATFRRRDGGRVVVFNPLHSRGRTRSDQAHELAHIILQHRLRTVERVGGFSFMTCDVEQEEEADWLGGCLLLPRPLLLKAAFSRKSPAQLAKECETSEHMARFRLNASGVLVQMGRAKAGSRGRGAQRGP